MLKLTKITALAAAAALTATGAFAQVNLSAAAASPGGAAVPRLHSAAQHG